MTRLLLGTIATMLLIGATPAVAAAQDLNPCTPIAPGVRCASTVSGPWASMDFGAPKRELIPSESPWRWAPELVHALFTHHGTHAVRSPSSQIIGHRPLDCPMAKHGNPALDRKMVHAPVGGVTFSSVIVPAAPCKAK